MLSKSSFAVLSGITALQAFWLWMIARQNAPYLMAVVVVLVVVFAAHIARRGSCFKELGPMLKLAVGAIIGLVAAMLAAFVSECSLRGIVCLSRDFMPNIYYFPAISLAWVYGAIAFILLLNRNKH